MVIRPAIILVLVLVFASRTQPQQGAESSKNGNLLEDPWLSVLGGGLAAAVVTIAFSVWWDKQKQKASEDWEFRRYHANQLHFATFGLVEVFFAAKTELYFLSSTL